MKKNSLLFLPLITGLFVLLEVTPSLAIVNSVTPSTNDTNRTNGWAHVDVTPGVGSATVDFISTRTFWSCFEYRIDNEPNTVVGANPNPEITDGRWTQVCVNNSHSTKFLSANEFIDVRMVYGAETDERFDWTRFDVISPISTPTILGFLSPSLSCNSLTNSHSIIVDWSDSSGGAGGLSGYEYNIEYPKLGGGIGIWNAYFTNSQYAGSLNEGTHTIKVRARDMLGNVSAWSNSCNISSDWTAPDVEINNPAEGYVSGVVDIRGTVTDLHPHHYWLAIYSGNTKVAGPGTVNRFDSFTNESLMMWDTSLVPDGVYTIRLEARDAANNKDSGSIDWHTVTVDNTDPIAPEIIFPNPGQYFNTHPILNDWLEVRDASGIAYYRIEYNYDDGHTFSGAPYRTTTDTQRNHMPGTWEQGGVKFRVQAFDNAGNEGTWSEWRHYFYDITAPVVPSGIYFKDTDNNKTIPCSGVTNTKHLDVYWNAILGDPSFSHFEYSSFNAPSGSAGLVQKIFYSNYFNSSFWTIPIEGTYGVQLRSVDLAGNKSAWYGGAVGIDNSCQFRVDWTTPIVEITAPTDLISGSVDVRATFNDLNPLEYTYSITNTTTSDKVTLATVTSGEFTDTTIYTWDTTVFDDGEYEIFFKGTDKAGNYSELTETVTVDNEKPEASVLGALSFTVGDTTPRFITLTDNYNLETMCYTFDGSYSCSPISGTTYLWNVSTLINSLPIGNVTFSYFVVDEAGNQSDFDIFTVGDLPHSSDITVVAATPLQQVLGINGTNNNRFFARAIVTEEESEEDTTSDDTEELLLADTQENEDNNGEVLAETDQQDEKVLFPWWGYLLIAALLSFIIFILSRRRKEQGYIN